MRDIGVGDQLDGFEITDVIARGAMGSVFKALDTASNPAAVMRLKLHGRAKSPARYLRTLEPSLEATILRALEREPRDRHANASELLDALTSRPDIRSCELVSAAPHRRPWGAAHVVGVIVAMALTLLGAGSLL